MKKNFKKIIFAVLILAIVILPMVSFAQTGGTTGLTLEQRCGTAVNNIGNIICRIGFILNSIIPILLTLGVLYFVWGVIQYMINPEAEEKKKGRNKIIYGIIGLVIIVSLWGIVTLVINGFGLDQQESILINPSNIINNNIQISKSNSCYGAYTASANPKLGDLLNYATCVIGASVIPLLFILAVASFIWGVVQYVINSDSEEKRSKGRSFMIWGILALVVMASIWGMVQIFGNTFNINMRFYPTVKQ
jgi:hypothetical protein